MSQKLAELVAIPNGDVSLFDVIIERGKVVKDPAHAGKAVHMLTEFVQQMPEAAMRPSTNVAEFIAERIATIDEQISLQLNEIMHSPEFQQLESTWRGLDRLVKSGDTVQDLKIKVLPANKAELLKDFERSAGFDQSRLFKLIYEEEFGTLGGVPFSMLVTDYAFGRGPQDLRLLEELSHVAASAHAPMLTAPAPSLFDMESFLGLPAPRDLAKIFESGELAGWRSFRESEDSRYVAMSLPRVLLRLPYGPDTIPVEEFAFQEDCEGASHEKYLWGSSSWVLGERIIEAYGQHGWCAAIRGVEGGGKVGNLPSHFYKSVAGDTLVKCPTECAITDRREKELSDLGFLPLCYAKGTDYSVFIGGQTVNRPEVYASDSANANARLASMLPYMLAASRFAHYLKAIMRDKIGTFQSKASVEKYLNQWITRYVTVDDEASQDVKARYPLREASIEVHEVPGKVGVYSSVILLRPHFQLEELNASIRLVAQLPVSRS